jgi:hypothetical protein
LVGEKKRERERDTGRQRQRGAKSFLLLAKSEQERLPRN